jgi:hypothetical protein
MVGKLVSGPGTLSQLRKALPPKGRIAAAVAYATKDDHLHLRAGDRIVVNASDFHVCGGATDPAVVSRWLDDGVIVSSNERLHAKVVTCGRWTAVGSANLSERANRVEEAVWVCNDPSALMQATKLINRLETAASQLNKDWVTAMIPVFNTASGPRQPKPPSADPGLLDGGVGRVIIADGEWSPIPPPKYVDRKLSPARSRARFQLVAHQVEASRGLKPKDLLVWLEIESNLMDAPVLVTSRPARAGTPTGWVIGRTDRRHKSGLPLPTLPRSVRTRLRNDGYVTLTSRSTKAAVLAAWGLTLP